MRRAGVHLTTVQIAEAKQLHADGWSCPRIAEKFGVDRETVKRAVDPEYQALRAKQVREARQRREEAEARTHSKRIARENATCTSVKADGAARLAEIPPDTRSLTARLCGDPLPGRDALSKARSGASA